MKIESWVGSEEKARFKIVRTDNYTDVAGEIVTADESTGECSVLVPKLDDRGVPAADCETKTLCFGPGGIRIVPRGWR